MESDQRVDFRGHEDDPIKMWQLLEAAYLLKKLGACFNAYVDLFSESLMDLGVSIEKAMQAIQTSQPLLGFTIEQLDEELQCMALVHVLPDEFCHLASTLLLVNKLDKAMILQAFRSEELNRQHNGESVNKTRTFEKGAFIADITCYFCKKKRHTTHNCAALKVKLEREKKAEDTKKAVGEKAAAVTEFASQASAVDDHEANVTSSDIFH